MVDAWDRVGAVNSAGISLKEVVADFALNPRAPTAGRASPATSVPASTLAPTRFRPRPTLYNGDRERFAMGSTLRRVTRTGGHLFAYSCHKLATSSRAL